MKARLHSWTCRATLDHGATSVEYALIAALIAVVVIAAVTLLGSNLSGLYSSAASSIP